MPRRTRPDRFTLGTLAPCEKCPYRRDAPIGLWAREEFERLLESDVDTLGVMYGCHKGNGHFCAGWLLDQRARDFPSVALRARKAIDRELAVGLRRLHAGGHELYDSVEEMCAANGARPPERLEERYAALLRLLTLEPTYTADSLLLLGSMEATRAWRWCVAGARLPLIVASGDVHAWLARAPREWPAHAVEQCERCALLAALPDGDGNPLVVLDGSGGVRVLRHVVR